jgi:predicted CXXCH cytochrome family protein
MKPLPPTPPPRRRVRAALIITAGLLLVGGGLYAASRWWFWPGPAPADDPGLLAVYEGSPYRNVRPGVRYVGDAKCALCHEKIAESFRRHPMGRSLGPVAPDGPGAPPGAPPEFDKLGFHFSAQWQDGHLIHKVVRRDAEGRVAAEEATPVAYVMGSGTRGLSYLVEKDGYLFQSPISWFTQAGAWDLSPGFASFFPGQRVVEPQCLSCHANQAVPVADTRNRYEPPVFRGYAIGCERCHGPGELHVRKRIDEPLAVRGEPDDTIVHPGRLGPALRDAVCEQCHLQGERRVERRGRQAFDYRPGLPLHAFRAVFVRAPGRGPGGTAVGHVEQMHLSRCFVASAGKLGCISCHDPHGLPAPEKRVEYYRSRCQQCHEDKPCGLPREERARAAPGDSCVACHMERFASSDIAHTAVTDHRIPRKPDRTEPKPVPLGGDEMPVVNFYQDRLAPDDPDAARDLGVALAYLNRSNDAVGRRLATHAVRVLDGAVARHPDDVPAAEARGWALDVLDRPEEALQAYEGVLRQAPRRELTLALAAALAQRMRRTDDALAYRRRLVEINPWACDFHAELAKLLVNRGEWDAALREAEEAVGLNPLDAEARKALILACLRTGRRERAQQEKDVLLALRPQDALALIEWYRRQAR